MADEFNWDIVIRLATQGAKGSEQDIRAVSGAVDELARSGKINEKQQESHTRSLNKLSNAAGKTSGDLKEMTTSAISLRYANYDLATSMFTVSAAITAAGVAAGVAFGSQEAAFTEVERIVGGSTEQLGELRDELQSLSTQIPRSFQDLSGIAALGAALDIPRENLAAFADVVARFAAVTGVTEEAAASGFGRIAQYLGIAEAEYEGLGSAILKAGNISVATEEQVLKFTQALALPGARAGVAADQVVALGAAIASFGNINVEGAGSALNRIFTNIDRSVAEGGESLQNFASIAGLTAGEFGLAWERDAGEVLNRVIGGLSGNVDSLALNLDRLGVRNVRDRRVIEALAINYDQYRKILGETSQAMGDATYMSGAYGLVLDDLESKWQIFLNASVNAASAVGAVLVPSLKILLDTATDLLVAFSGFAQSEWGQVFIQMVGGVAAAVAVFTALRGGIALATASLLAFRTATAGLGGAGLRAGVVGLITAFRSLTGTAAAATVGNHNLAASFGGVAGSSVVASRGVLILRAALVGLLRATLVLGVIYAITEAVFNLGETMQKVASLVASVTGFTINYIRQVSNAISGLLHWIGGIVPGLRDVAVGMRQFTNAGITGLNDLVGKFQGWSDSLAQSSDGIEDLGYNAADIPWVDYSDYAEDWAGNLGDVGDSASKAGKELRTLKDYASDLDGVFSRAFEIRFSAGSTLDKITTTFLDLRDAAAQSARSIRSLKSDIQGLESDLNIQKYFLGVAIEFKDANRVQAIQANIAKLQSELADKTADLTAEQDKNNKTLTGNTRGAIENRQQIEQLVQQYQEHIVALASSGMSQADLARRTAELRAQFVQQATQLGYNRTEIEKYAKSFDDMKLIIANIPRNVTVTANANPAIQAMNEYDAAIKTAHRALNSLNAAGLNMPGIKNNTNAKEIRRMALEARVVAMEAYSRELLRSGNYSGAMRVAESMDVLRRDLRNGNYWTGGFTGQGGKYEPAGVVHRGEYVIPKKDVNQRTGLPYADALGRLQRGASGPGYANGGYVRGGGASMGGGMYLSPMGQQQFAQLFAQNMKVYLDGRTISQNSAAHYAEQTQVGAY